MPAEPAPRVAIVGGGFGGLAAAQALRSADVDVTLVDRTNHHLFQPLLYQVAAGDALDGRMRGADPRDAAQAVQRARGDGRGHRGRRRAARADARPRREGRLRQPDRRLRRRHLVLRARRVAGAVVRAQDAGGRRRAARSDPVGASRRPSARTDAAGAAAPADVRRHRRRPDRRRDRRAARRARPVSPASTSSRASTRADARVILLDAGERVLAGVQPEAVGEGRARAGRARRDRARRRARHRDRRRRRVVRAGRQAAAHRGGDRDLGGRRPRGPRSPPRSPRRPAPCTDRGGRIEVGSRTARSPGIRRSP